MQLSSVADGFGEVNVYANPTGGFDIVATVLTIPSLENARMGLALDASASMQKAYGVSGIVSSVFAAAAAVPNIVEPVARTIASYLAGFSIDGKVEIIYWALTADGSGVERLGAVAGPDTLALSVTGPKKQASGQPWGRGTKLLPAVRYFADAFKGAPPLGAEKPGAVCVFVSDGKLDDLADVKGFCLQYAQNIKAGTVPFLKFVLLGVGAEVDEGQMEDLDDMFEGTGLTDAFGTPIDLWDHKLAADMKDLAEVFAELVSEKVRAADSGRVVNDKGVVCREYSDFVPALLRFTLPAGSRGFTLELPGGSVTQDISQAARP